MHKSKPRRNATRDGFEDSYHWFQLVEVDYQ